MFLFLTNPNQRQNKEVKYAQKSTHSVVVLNRLKSFNH